MAQVHRRRRGVPYPVRATAWVLIAALLAPVLPAGAQETPAPPDAARLIPADAVAVAAFDLRSEEPTVKLLVEQLKPQERAIGAALIALLGQVGLSTLSAGLDFDTDVLPWISRRAYAALVPAADGGQGQRLLALVEVKDEAAAARALDVILPKAVAAAKGKLFQRQVGDTLLRHVAVPGFGHLQLMLKAGVLALSPDTGLLEQWAKQTPAASGDTDWARAMRRVAPGPIVVSLTPGIAGMLGAPVAASGLTAAALSASASQAGTRMEIVLQAPTGSAGKAVEQLGRMSVSGEALGAVPESAVAVLSAAPVGDLLESLGMKALVTGGLREALGARAQRILPRLQPVLDAALKGETTIALMALTPVPRLLNVVVQPDESTATAAVSALREAFTDLPDAKVTSGEAGGFSVVLPADGPKLLREVHVASAGKWFLAATDAETLQSALATAQAPQPAGIAANPAYKGTQEQIGGSSALVLFADTRALGRALTTLLHQQLMKGEKFDLPAKYLVRLVDAFLLPLGGTGLNVSAREGAGRITLFQQVDWRSAAGNAAAAPAVVAIVAAVALPAFLRAQKSGKESAARQTLKSLRMAEDAYRVEANRYGNLNQLKAKGLIAFGEGAVEPTSGYRFRSRNVTATTYVIIAEAPRPDMTTYTMRETGAITP